MIRHAPLIIAAGLAAAILLPDFLPDRQETASTQPGSGASAFKPVTIVAWVDRPLFHQSRKPFVPSADASSDEAGGNESSGGFAERFEVKGFGRANGKVLAIVVEKDSNTAFRIYPGDKIEDWLFEDEKDGTVTFRSEGGQSVSLTLARLP